MNTYLRKTLALLVLVVMSATIVAGCTPKKEETKEEKAKKQVTTQIIERQDEVVSTLTASGVIVPKQYSAVRSLVQGTLEYVSPVGTQVSIGTPLFRIRDEAIENAHFNALQNLQQTNILTEERISQSQLNLNSAEARHALAEKNLETTTNQAAQTLVNAQNSAVVSYNSAYNTLSQFFNFISVGSVSNLDYKYENVSTTNIELKEKATLQYDAAAKKFLKLVPTASRENLDQMLTQINDAIDSAKLISDSTVILLQNTLGGVSNLSSDQTVLTSYQTQINGHISAIINSQNALRNTLINNGLITDQSKNQLELAKIELNNAMISLDNAKNSADLERTISKSQFDNASYSYNNLSLASPFSGTVMSNNLEAGQQVSTGQQILELGNLDIVEIDVEIDTEFAKGLKQGDAVKINEVYEGIISEIEPTGNISSGKVGVKIQTDNTQGFLVAGEIAEITFSLVFKQDGLVIIPIKTATIESTDTYVYVVNDGKAQKRSVTLGQIFGNQVSVTSGLEAEDEVILKNGVFISEGDEVEVK